MTSPASLSVITDSEPWLRQLERAGQLDSYLLPQWCRSAAQFEGGTPTLLAWEDQGGSVLLSILERSIPGSDCFDATTPYGYGGAIRTGQPNLQDFQTSLLKHAQERRIVTLFCRLHPLLDASSALPGATRITRRGSTIAWRIGAIDDLFAHLHKKHRYCVSRCRRDGMSVRRTPGTNRLANFRNLYDLTMARKGADSRYFFREAYWKEISQGQLQESIHQFDVLDENGELAASALLLCASPHVHYHLSASSDRGRKHGATVLLLLEAATWAKSLGYQLMHLGGGLGAQEDELYKFKKRFDDQGAVPFSTASLVFDPQRYRSLCHDLGYRPAPDPSEGYFPCWRDPSNPPTPKISADEIRSSSRSVANL